MVDAPLPAFRLLEGRVSCALFEGIGSADLVPSRLLLCLYLARYVFAARPSCRVWTRQHPSFNSRVQERSSKDVTTISLAPSFYSHMLRVSKHMCLHDRHPPTRHLILRPPFQLLPHTPSSPLPRGRITNSGTAVSHITPTPANV